MRDAWRRRDHLGAGEHALPSEIETYDAVHPLDADVEPSVPFGKGLGVVPSARRERAAVRAKHRRHHGIGNAQRLAAFIDDAAGEPPSLISEGNKMLPVRRDADRGKSSKMRIGRLQFEPAKIFHHAEAPLVRCTEAKGSDWLGVHYDTYRPIDADPLGLGRRCDHKGRARNNRPYETPLRHDKHMSPASRFPATVFAVPAGLPRTICGHACNRRSGHRTGSDFGLSSNSSASFSIIAPPSSSASTIVTARR